MPTGADRPSDGSARPTFAFFLAIVSACAMVGYASFVLPAAFKVATQCNPAPKGVHCVYSSFWGLPPDGFLAGAVILLALGPVIGAVGVAAYARARYRRSGGAAVIALAVVSLVGYGGAIVGVITGVLAGVLFLRFRRGPAIAPTEWSGSYPAGVPPPRGAPLRPITERPGVTEWPGASAPAVRAGPTAAPAAAPPASPVTPTGTPGPSGTGPPDAAPPSAATPPTSGRGAPPARSPTPSDTFPRRMPLPRPVLQAARVPSTPPVPATPGAAPAPPPRRDPIPSWVPPAPPSPSPPPSLSSSPGGTSPKLGPLPPPRPPAAPLRPVPATTPPPSSTPQAASAALPPSDPDRPPAPSGPLPPKRMRVWVCPTCKLVNAPWSQHCTKCGTAAPVV